MSDILTPEQPAISVWREERDVSPSYYGVPNSVVLSSGNTVIRNCLSLELKSVIKEELQPYQITPETASEYLSDFITTNTASVTSYMQNLVAETSQKTDTEKIKNLDSALKKADWAKIISECLELTPGQIEQNPQLFKTKLQEFLTGLLDSINNTSSSILEPKNAIFNQIQKVLSSHNIELGNSLEQLIGLLQRFIQDDSYASTDKAELRKELQSLSQINRDELDVETIISKYEALGMEEAETNSDDSEYNQKIDKAFQDIVEDYPLPSFDFDDLLKS